MEKNIRVRVLIYFLSLDCCNSYSHIKTVQTDIIELFLETASIEEILNKNISREVVIWKINLWYV